MKHFFTDPLSPLFILINWRLYSKCLSLCFVSLIESQPAAFLFNYEFICFVILFVCVCVFYIEENTFSFHILLDTNRLNFIRSSKQTNESSFDKNGSFTCFSSLITCFNASIIYVSCSKAFLQIMQTIYLFCIFICE